MHCGYFLHMITSVNPIKCCLELCCGRDILKFQCTNQRDRERERFFTEALYLHIYYLFICLFTFDSVNPLNNVFLVAYSQQQNMKLHLNTNDHYKTLSSQGGRVQSFFSPEVCQVVLLPLLSVSWAHSSRISRTGLQPQQSSLSTGPTASTSCCRVRVPDQTREGDGPRETFRALRHFKHAC